ncbi:MAG: SDR family NAD(P)-dependent oxidoreductase [Solirubrobacterales bacterium]
MERSSHLCLDGRVAVVTGGAGGGVGTATARLLAARGAAVVVNGRPDHADRLESICRELRDRGSEAVALAADVGRSDAAAELVDSIFARFGRLDVLVHNASSAEPRCELANLSDEGWREEMAPILDAAFYCTRAAVPRMQPGASIVLLSSSAAARGARGRSVAYTSAKAGLLGLTRQLALDLGPAGIRVNAVAPAQIDTARIRRDGRRTDQSLRDYGARLPLGRVGSAREVAELIAFLASDAAAYVTGQTVAIDGGGSLAPAYTATVGG